MKQITKMMICAAMAMSNQAPAEAAPDFRYPETFNNVESKNNNPGHKPAPLLTLEEFFGTWDAANAAWVTPGLFDYASRPGLEPVAAAVKRGDYQAAGDLPRNK